MLQLVGECRRWWQVKPNLLSSGLLNDKIIVIKCWYFAYDVQAERINAGTEFIKNQSIDVCMVVLVGVSHRKCLDCVPSPVLSIRGLDMCE